MSSEFDTELFFYGTDEEALSVMEYLKETVVDQKKNYTNKDKSKERWYLEPHFAFRINYDALENEETMIKFIKEQRDKDKDYIYLDFGGPYGIFDDFFEIDLFENITDIAPNARFAGVIFGEDPGAKMGIRAELSDGEMRRWQYYVATDEEFFEWEEDSEEECEDEDSDEDTGWDEIKSYFPIFKD